MAAEWSPDPSVQAVERWVLETLVAVMRQRVALIETVAESRGARHSEVSDLLATRADELAERLGAPGLRLVADPPPATAPTPRPEARAAE